MCEEPGSARKSISFLLAGGIELRDYKLSKPPGEAADILQSTISMGEVQSSTSEGQPPQMGVFTGPPRVQRDPRVRSLLATIHGPPRERWAEREHPVRSAMESGYVRLSAGRRTAPSVPPNSKATSGVEETDQEQASDPRNIRPLLVPPEGSSDVSGISPAVSGAGASQSPKQHRLYVCGHCDAFFSKRNTMHDHVQTVHLRYSAKCIQCQGYFKSRKELDYH